MRSFVLIAVLAVALATAVAKNDNDPETVQIMDTILSNLFHKTYDTGKCAQYSDLIKTNFQLADLLLAQRPEFEPTRLGFQTLVSTFHGLDLQLAKCKVDFEMKQMYQMAIALYRPLSFSVSENAVFVNGLNVSSSIAEMHEEFNSENSDWAVKFGRRVAGLLKNVFYYNNATLAWQNQISYSVLSGALQPYIGDFDHEILYNAASALNASDYDAYKSFFEQI